MTTDIRDALIIVDFQNDFCPPTGSLAIPKGRDIAPLINELLTLPFVLRVATQDWHPEDHISFAANHSPPENKPFESHTTIVNPENPEETISSRLWPVHCVQDTEGAKLVDELNADLVDVTVRKGRDARLEMYSAFATPFTNPPVGVSTLGPMLKAKGITHVYCVGLALDYCVKCTAIDAAKLGFTTYVIKDATAAVGDTTDAEADMQKAGVQVITSNDKAIKRLRDLGQLEKLLGRWEELDGGSDDSPSFF